jgi:hypothetical protein
MHNFKLFVFFLLMPIGMQTIYSQTILSGDISKCFFDASNNPFVVKADIEVPKNKRVVIHEGCVFLFEAFAGLIVSGSLQVDGTASGPVIFTSIKDAKYGIKHDSLAAPFDWNGIYIQPSADSVNMNNFKLGYSVYGIKAQNRNIVIRNGVFRDNGQYHCVINERQQNVEDNYPYSYPDGQNTPQAAVASVPVVSTQTGASSGNQVKKRIFLTSFPPEAEVYCNKQPDKHVWKNGVTPITLPAEKGTGGMVTLFKSGYESTTFQIDYSQAQSTMHVVLLPLRPDKVEAQHQFLYGRLQARIGLGCLIAAPVFVGTGAWSTYYAYDQRKTADASANFLRKTLLPKSDPEYLRRQDAYNEANENTDVGRNGAITAFCVGAALLGAGLTLYW